MKKAGIFVILAMVLLSLTLAFAKDRKEKESAAKLAQQTSPATQTQTQTPAMPTEQDLARQELIANLNGMRNQELRVAILQQLLNEESGKLLNIQAVFCDRYRLDVEKWRNGLYRYDEKQGKFVEQPSTPTLGQ